MELTWTLFKSLNKSYDGELFETSGFHLPFDPLRPLCGVCALSYSLAGPGPCASHISPMREQASPVPPAKYRPNE